MTQRLEIEVGLSRDAATDSAKRLRAELKGLSEGVVNDARVATQAETELHRKAKDERSRLARQTADASEAAYKRSGDAGKASFGAMAMAAGATLGVVKEVAGQVAQLAATLDRVGQKSRELSREFTSQRDRTRELAMVEGKTADNAFTLGIHRFGVQNALSFTEALDFRSAFANNAQQFRDRTISARELEQYQALTAKNMSRSNASADSIALFGASFLQRDLKGFGEGAAEEAIRQQMQVASIYDAGTGTATENYGAYAALKAALQGDPSLNNAFKNDTDIAVIGSIANMAGASRQRDQVNDLVRNLRRTDNKELNALYAKAGVTPGMDVRATIEKIAPLLIQESKEKGIGVDQIIGKYIPDVGAREALSNQVIGGVKQGGYAQRDAVAGTVAAPGAGENLLDAFMKTETARDRIASAEGGLANAERAAENSGLDILRKQALARLIRDRRIDTNASAVQDFLSGKMSFGFLGDADQKRIDDETQRLINARTGESSPWSLAITPQAREAELRDRVTGARAKGIDILAPNPQAESGIDTREGLILKDGMITNLLGQIANNTAPAKAPPRPLVEVPPMQRR